MGIAGDMSNILQGGAPTAPVVPATGATAGAPGTWTPPGSTPPASVAALAAGSVAASPATAWTTGEYVQTATAGAAGQAHWDGAAWVSGLATLEVGADPNAATVQQVKDYVTAHPDERDRILAEEQAGQARVTLIDWLTAFTP